MPPLPAAEELVGLLLRCAIGGSILCISLYLAYRFGFERVLAGLEHPARSVFIGLVIL